MNRRILEGKMSDWGPFGEKESQWLIFSMGNPNEGHGLALPRAIDDYHSKNIAYKLEFATGQRYIAHIPYTTDRAGVIAKDWSPSFIPWTEFFEKTIEFIKFHLNLIWERGDDFSRVIVLNGHGGNEDFLKRKLQREVQKELGLKKFIATSAFVSKKTRYPEILAAAENLAKRMIVEKTQWLGCKKPEELNELYQKIVLSVAHASHLEHSLAAAMGMCDMSKVEVMNKLLRKDFEAALRRWPPLGGLGGYLLAGKKYTEVLGTKSNDKFNLWNCLEGLREINNGKLVICPELGLLIQEYSVKEKIDMINKYW